MKIISILFIILLFTDLKASCPLTLEKAFAIALDQNPRQRAADEDVLVYNEQFLAAYAPYYPDLTAFGSYYRFRDFIFLPQFQTFDNLQVPNVVGPVNDWMFNLQSRWILFDSGLRRARLYKALSNRYIAESQRAQISNAILLQVAESFFDYLRTQRLVEVAYADLNRSLDHLRIAESRQRVGAVPPVDLFRTKNEVAQANLTLIRAKSNFKIAQGTLNTVMGLPADQCLEVANDLGLDIDINKIDLCEYLQSAYYHRPEIDERLYQINYVEETIHEIKSEYGPTIRASGLYGKHDSDFFPKQTQWNFGVSIELPLFEGFRTTHNLKRARHQLYQAVANHDETALQVRQDVWNSHARLVESRQAISAASASELYAQESHRLANKRYAIGAGTLNELLDAETSLYQAEQDLVNSQFSFYTSYAQFLWSTGTISCFGEID